MPTDLAQHVQQIRIHDTHEHQVSEEAWAEGKGDPRLHVSVRGGPADVLADVFSGYEGGDLVTAGMSKEGSAAIAGSETLSLAERWKLIAPWWEAIRLTGFGEAVSIHARELYGIEEITARTLLAAQPALQAYRRPGGRLHLLRDRGGLDHIQTDAFSWACRADASGPEFFFYDLSVLGFASAQFDFPGLAAETGVTVADPASLRQAMAALFAKYGPQAIAIKSQHAYNRTLAWRARSDGEAAAALRDVLAGGEKADAQARLCVGDWCIARAAELAAEHNLPFKIHTGYYAGNGYMRTGPIAAGNLCDLLAQHPRTRFVLMHIAYPHQMELLGIAKHFANVWVDLCWAWAIDPYATMDFVRRFIHAVPANKLLGFGGDTLWPTRGAAYAMQSRRWLTRTLEREVSDGHVTEREAMALASRFLGGNQAALFDLAGKRALARATVGGGQGSMVKV